MSKVDHDLLTKFTKFLSRPEGSLMGHLFHEEGDAGNFGPKQLRDVCGCLFEEVERLHQLQQRFSTRKKDKKQPKPLAGLDRLYLGSEESPVDAETLWGQVDLQNGGLKQKLKKSLKRLSKVAEMKGNGVKIRLLDDDLSDSEEENEGDNDEDQSSNNSEQDLHARRIKERMERAMADMDDDDDDDDDELGGGQDEGSELREQHDNPDLVDPAAEELNDGFFDINEMEAFADEEEDYLPEDAFGEVKPETDDDDQPKKKSFHQRQREGDFDSGSDDDDDEAIAQPLRRRKYRPDDEVDALFTLYETPKAAVGIDNDDDSVVNMTAADVFGPPNKKHHRKKGEERQSLSTRKNMAASKFDSDVDSWDDEKFEEEGDWGNLDQGGEDDGDEDESPTDDDKDDAKMEGDVPKNSASSKKMPAQKLLNQTEQLEKDLIAEKPWHMTGETKGTSRPVNSLLETTPEFEVATKMAPVITLEHTENLEDVIKRRILNDDWDDVVPRELPDVGWNKQRGELPEVSQEKSKLGLGELYEREYLKKAANYDVDAVEKQTEEEKAKSEMRGLFANLCSKLDALSNYHFAPRPIADESEIKPATTPAIAMEEVLPLHVSNARGVAPEEVYGAKKGREGILRAESEMSQAERKRLRNAKKAARRKARKEKLADEKLISRLQPGLGLNNPYEKRKARQELAMARSRGKVKDGERDDQGGDYSASGKFFKRMQEEVEKSVRGDDSTERTKKRRRRDGAGDSKRSSAIKL